jgi:hypothetical protein
MGYGRAADVLWLSGWVLGIVLVASIGGIVGPLLLGAWTSFGATFVLRDRAGAGHDLWVGLLAAWVVLGLLWWWAMSPTSVLAAADSYLGPAFWGSTVGLVAGRLKAGA